MSDPEVKTDPAPVPAVEPAPSPRDDKPEAIPYDRFKAVNDEKKALAEQVAEMKAEQDKTTADQEKVRKAQLEKQGEYKTLLEEANASLETMTSERNTAVEWRTDYETNRRETLTSELSEDDKAMAMKIPDLTDMEAFVNRISETKLPGTETRRSTHINGDLKPIAQMSNKEQRETHEARLAEYR